MSASRTPVYTVFENRLMIAATEAIVRRYAKCGAGTTLRNEDDH
ncbi:hypothetical protein [uncultured Nostoc sp.]|nr:hypothetical protein [uncultured Nostoc sp.]